VRDNMPPNFTGAELDPQTKLDIVSHILNTNEIPVGRGEMKPDRDALDELQIVKKGAAASMPNFAVVQVVGCLAKEGGTWTLTHAAKPAKQASAFPAKTAAPNDRPLGDDTLLLTSVKGFTATLLAKWDRFNDDQKKLMLETVNADADRVTRLLTELLDVSRIDAGRLEMRKQVIDLPAVVHKIVAGRVASGDPQSRFVVNVDGELPEMWLDPDKIEQVIGNLVENALRHGEGTVTVNVRPFETGAEVTVADEGEGIPEETATRVFTRFWRGGNRRGGTGLGLYIVKGLVEAHGGSVEVGRSPSGGAQFRFVLPAGSPPFEQV